MEQKIISIVKKTIIILIIATVFIGDSTTSYAIRGELAYNIPITSRTDTKYAGRNS